MRAVLSFVKRPLVVALLGLAAVTLLVWFVGPLIAIAGYEPLEGQVARLLLIVLIVGAWGLLQLRNRLRETRANAQLAEGLVEPAADSRQPAGAERENEVALLGERFSEAIGLLRKSKRGKDSASLYSLPWYVIIGPPGAGKTTALQNSGLRFPLADRFGNEALRGVGGTRNCDWWFTDEAILLDTAGRYTTQDSDNSADKAAWEGFLGLLKKNRRRRPLNGVLVAISLSDLLLQGEAERAAHAAAVKQRITELYEYFGIRLPIYVLLTKADLVAGFNEFFGDLGQAERAQVWGFTLPLAESESPSDIGARVLEEYDALLRRVNERVFARLERERDLPRRALILGFPRQMAMLRGVLEQFLIGIFQPSRYASPPLLRGIYLTSGTQEGTPIDRLLGSVARSFGLTSQALAGGHGPGRSYFITDVLRRVVFPEADLAGTNQKIERLRAWGQRGSYVGAAALVVVLGVAWFLAYRANRRYIDDVASQTRTVSEELAALQPSAAGVAEVLPILNGVADIRGGWTDREAGGPWSLGLSQWNKLGGAAQDGYRRILEQVFLPRVVLRLEEQVRNAPADSDYRFEALKVYRMLGEGAHFDPEAAKAWIQLDWETVPPGRMSAADQKRLGEHLDALLELPPGPAPIALDGALILERQRELRGAPLAERAYARLRRHSPADIAPFTVADAAGREAAFVFARKSGAALTDGISGFYTQQGYEKVFLPGSRRLAEEIGADRWVLVTPGDVAEEKAPSVGDLETDVLRLYLADYGAQYTGLLADVAIVPIATMDQAVAVLKVLSDRKSPLLRLLQGVARETSFGTSGDEKEAEEGEKAGALDAAKERLRGLLGDTATSAAKRATRGFASPVEEFAKEKFGELQEQVLAPEGAQPPFQSVLDIMNELFVFLDAIRKNPNAARALMEGSGQLNAIVGSLEREAGRQPAVVQGVIGEVAQMTRSLSSGDVRKHLDAKWKGNGLAFCQQAIAGRYPIEKNAQTDISLSDFARFFGPGGIMDKFFEENLTELVDTTQTPWKWRPGGGMAQASQAGLAQFQRARRIRDTFFGQGGDKPSVSFDLTPITMDASITRIVVDVEGQRVVYDHGPAVPTAVTWPGPGPRQVRVELTPPAAGGAGATESGPWGWFRLLDRAKMTSAGSAEQFEVTFTIGERSARFRLAANSVFNPFGSDLLRAFRCPGGL